MRSQLSAQLAPILLAALLPLGCLTVDLGLGSPPPELVESVIYGDGGPKILLVQIDGVISEQAQSTLFGLRESRVARLREELERAVDDDEIRALLLRIDSPGGTVTGTDLLYGEVLRFKRERGIPVVAQLMSVAASGGYYVAMAADHVVAQPTGIIGSIGVRFGGISFAGLMEKIGVEDETLVTGPYKDSGSPLRRMRPEERDQLMSVLDDLYVRFKSVVDEGREELDAEAVAQLADGRVFSAPQALELGLVDALGGIEDAIAETRHRAGLDSSRVVTYHRPREHRDNVYSASPMPAAALQLDLGLGMPELPGLGTSFLYLWAQGAPWRLQ